jgi:serine/threonine-protein kinase RsbW
MQSRLIVRIDSSAMRQVDGFVTGFASQRGITTEEAHRILILIEELLTNLMKYGYPDGREPGRAEITLAVNGDRVEIEFIDDGCAFDPFAGPPADLDQPVESRPLGGLGLHLLRSMCDETRYERRGDRNVVRLTRKIAPRQSS